MAQVARLIARGLGSGRCPHCRGTGAVTAACARDCAAHPVPCSCRDRRVMDEDERRALRVELMLGVPIAGAAAALLAIFH